MTSADVDFVSAHGTGTPLNDRIEAEVLRRLLGRRASEIPVNSIKASVGHTMGAAAALEAVMCLLAGREGIVPYTLGLEEPDPACELDHVIERAVLMTRGPQIKAADLGLTTGTGESRGLEEMSLEEVEAFLIKKALARNDGNARKAAEALGLSRSAFYRRLQQYGL